MAQLTGSDLVAMLAAFGLLLTTIGGAFKWAIAHTDRKTKEAEDRATRAAKLMQDHLEGEINSLRARVERLTASENLYLRRVIQLEAFIQGQKGLELPPLENWPPR